MPRDLRLVVERWEELPVPLSGASAGASTLGQAKKHYVNEGRKSRALEWFPALFYQ